MWPCPYCKELHPVASRVDHLTIRHNRFPCLSCDLVCASAGALTKHDEIMHRYTVKDGGPFDGVGSVGPVMEVSGFIMEVLLTLRDIKEQQNVQFGKLTEQIRALKGELEEAKRSAGQRLVDGEGERVGEVQRDPLPLELEQEMIYTEPWSPKEYFPIKSVEQLQQLDEISRFAENHVYYKDLKILLEAQNPDGWNPNGLVEFGKTFDRTFAQKLFVTSEETPKQCISLGDYKAFIEVLRDSWKAAGPKRINRRLRHYLKLNRENSTSNSGVEDSPQVNTTSDETDRNVNGKRVIVPEGSEVSSDQLKDGEFVVLKRLRGTTIKFVNFRQEQQQLSKRAPPGKRSCM